MTLEYRCSNCGTLLQTTNADSVSAEIERLQRDLAEARAEVTRVTGFRDGLLVIEAQKDAEIERLQEAWHGRCVIIDEREAEIERLRARMQRHYDFARFVYLWTNRDKVTDEERVSVIKYHPFLAECMGQNAAAEQAYPKLEG